jgi:hypothetical protein
MGEFFKNPLEFFELMIKDHFHQELSMPYEPEFSPYLLHYYFEFSSGKIAFPMLLNNNCFFILDFLPTSLKNE